MKRILNKGKSIFNISMKNFTTKKVDPFGGQYLKDPIPNPNRLKDKFAIITGGASYLKNQVCLD